MKTLVLFDHDGTICLTNENAYESIKFAAREALSLCGAEVVISDEDWSVVFSETRGTTERNVVGMLYGRYCHGNGSIDFFTETYMQARANWYHNMKSYNNYIYDTYYPDAENFLYYCYHHKDCIVGLLTGNPKETMKARLAAHLQDIFFNNDEAVNVFGDEAGTRAEMIEIALNRAKEKHTDFETIKTELGIMQNVIYVADSRKDFTEGLSSKVRMLWVPARTLQGVEEVRAEDGVQMLLSVLPKNIFHITNNLEHPKTIEFVFGAESK
jgi:phosphoglycolate phosphatase-like HAD superfamily hydrolase